MNSDATTPPQSNGTAPRQWDKNQFSKKIAVRRLREDELGRAIPLLRTKVPAAHASDDAIKSVLRKNPDSIWGIYREGEENRPVADILGFFCMLMLTEEGARRIREGTFNTTDPDLDHLAGPGERPAAIYYWAIVAEGLTIPAGPMIIIELGPFYSDIPLYVRPTTDAGLKRVRKSSYLPVVPGRDGMGDLFTMDRYPDLTALRQMQAQQQPRHVSRRRLESRIQVRVASTPSEMEMAMRIRGVYLVEQRCPYDEEFDGNDYCGTTFVGFVDGEPAGTLRVRYFAGFVKIERLTVLPRFRNTTTVGREIVKAAISFCARKGYRKGYGHSQIHAIKFWQRFGFRPMLTNRTLVFSDHQYIEIEGDFPAHDNPITMHGDPYLILRPEGRWDEAGVLDRSAARPATNPH